MLNGQNFSGWMLVGEGKRTVGYVIEASQSLVYIEVVGLSDDQLQVFFSQLTLIKE